MEDIRYDIKWLTDKPSINGHFVIEKCFSYGRYMGVVVFTDMGHRCGYVILPKGEEEKYKEIAPYDIPVSCHGGVTYFEQGHDFLNTEQWLIGFDCSHLNDSRDIESLKKYFPDNERLLRNAEFFYGLDNGVVRDSQYVVDELISMCNQLEDNYFEGKSESEKALIRLVFSLNDEQTKLFGDYVNAVHAERVAKSCTES